MLKIIDSGLHHTCEGISRREWFRIGTVGLTGLTLPGALALKSSAAAGASSPVRDRAVVVLFLGGGPPQHETFDPKMSAPAEYRAMFGEVQTKLPGVTFGSHFDRLAERADRLSIVRSFRHGNSSHGSATSQVISGGNATEAQLGSIFSRVAGTTHPQTGMPTNVMLGPAAAGAGFKGNPDYTQRCAPIGSLSKSFQPFDPAGGGQLKQNMELRIPRGRFDDRRSLLAALDDAKRGAELAAQRGLGQFNEQAIDVLIGGVTEAFDLQREDPRTVAAYDTSHIKIPPSVFVRKKGKKGFAEQTPEYLGKQMLLARRMVEAGCRFVTVTSTGWDLHGNRFGVDDGMPVLGSAVNHAVAAFMDDLQERGMFDDVLLVVTGEFGRTPKINAKAGRDHWGNLCPLMFAGGGLPMGQVIGQSDRLGGAPAADPVSLPQVASTILRTVLDPGILRLHPDVPTEINAAVAQNPIPGLAS
ncbi:MAG: hypothetical protein CL681_12680 [Blastopirellula sp.]|nr:hypothetical protein [Blastopirellula sp.]